MSVSESYSLAQNLLIFLNSFRIKAKGLPEGHGPGVTGPTLSAASSSASSSHSFSYNHTGFSALSQMCQFCSNLKVSMLVFPSDWNAFCPNSHIAPSLLLSSFLLKCHFIRKSSLTIHHKIAYPPHSVFVSFNHCYSSCSINIY